MDRLDYQSREELLRFFHYKKTLMSCMERPHTFLSQLRDHDLIPEDRYKTASLLSSKEKLKKALYDILDQFERERPQDIRAFWKCVFNDVIMNEYPTLRLLHNSLMDGSFHFNKHVAETVGKDWADEKKRKVLSEDEGENSGKEKKKQRTGSVCSNDEEPPGPSSQLIPALTLRKGEKSDISSPIFTLQLPVTCGELEGTLVKDRLAKGEKCILFQKQWFTPGEFERLAGRQSSRNWKLSIRCSGTTLGKLIQEGHLAPVTYKGGCKKRNKPLCPSEQAVTDEEGTDEESEEETEQPDADPDGGYMVFEVVCDDIRFEAVAEAPRQTDGRTDIKSEGSFQQISEDGIKQELSEGEEKSRRVESLWGSDEQQPGPSSQLTPRQRTQSEKILLSPSLKEAERGVNTSSFSQSQLPVTCGHLEGMLSKDRLAKGDKCILFQKQWFTPSEFERHAGKTSSRNWKLSIRCSGTTLGKLIQEGHLASVKYKGGCKKVNKPWCLSEPSATDEEESEQLDDHDGRDMVFSVTCGAKAGTLHRKRFASGSSGLSIRTETRWMTPEEFVKEASCKADASWRQDIQWRGKPLSVLIDGNMLRIHSACGCKKCQPNQKDLENQQNDDECCVCKSDLFHLVVCDFCPRAFHQKCHLPHVEDADLRDDRPWMCTFCEFSHYGSGEELEMQAAMSQYISRHKLKCQYLLLFLCCADEQPAPARNPKGESSSTVAQTPLSFSNVANKLQGREYQTVEQLVSDVQLVFTNRAKHNQDGAAVPAGSRPLKEVFDGEFRKVFNIH